jgi:hypothetical protein
MEISKGMAGGLMALCLTAGAGGAYLASRDGEPTPAAATLEAPSISPDPAAVAVDQSEAVVDLPATPVSERPAASAAPAPPVRAAARPAARTAPARPERNEPAPIAAEAPRVLTPPALEPVTAVETAPVRTVAPPQPEFEELVVVANSVVGLEVESSITSEQAQVEDEVVARVTRDVRVGDRVAIPAGSRAHGEVTLVERGGRLRERARLGIRFTSVVLADGTRVPLTTETIYREGDAPGGESAAKIGGGAIGGAIIGGILGGAKGAAIGGSVGAGAGTAAVLAGGRNPATLPSGTPVTVRVVEPTSVTVER